MSKYGQSDAARDTGASRSEVRSAWHDAREATGDVRNGGTGDRTTNREYSEAYEVGQRYGLGGSSSSGVGKYF